MPTIAAIASGDARFSILINALVHVDEALPGSNLVEMLSRDAADLTVFAPTDAAFTRLAADLGYGGPQEDEAAGTGFLVQTLSPQVIRDVILYHVASGSQAFAQIAALPVVLMLNGSTLTADGATLIDHDPDLRDPVLIETDVQASNGILHVVDRVLLPVDLPGPGRNVDVIMGDATAETINSGTGDDVVDGRGGNDTINGGSGDDLLAGGTGNDRVIGGTGNDTLQGGEGRDMLWGKDGDDLLRGGGGKDLINGGWGNDTILGEAGNDTIYGASGDDIIVEGRGADVIWGQAGADVFVFRNGAGADLVVDFEGGMDRLDLRDFGIASWKELQTLVTQSDRGAVITHGNDSITLFGVLSHELTSADVLLS